MNIFQRLLLTEADPADVKTDDESKRMTIEDLRALANDYLKQFLEIIVQSDVFFNILPSQLAAAIVGSTRKLLQIGNYWNDPLISLTRCTLDDIRPIMKILVDERISLLYHPETNEETLMKDSGYTTSSETEDETTPAKKSRFSMRDDSIKTI